MTYGCNISLQYRSKIDKANGIKPKWLFRFHIFCNFPGLIVQEERVSLNKTVDSFTFNNLKL